MPELPVNTGKRLGIIIRVSGVRVPPPASSLAQELAACVLDDAHDAEWGHELPRLTPRRKPAQPFLPRRPELRVARTRWRRHG